MKSYCQFLSRNKLYAAIEAFGLAVALGLVIVLAAYAKTEYRVGSYQRLSKDLYIVGTGNYAGMTWGTPQEFFPSVPEIQAWTRFADFPSIRELTVNEHAFKTKACTVDPNFFQLFDYGLRGCSPERVLEAEDQAIVSESFAAKAFGRANPIGQTVRCDSLTFKIVGVVQDFDERDLLKPYDLFLSMNYTERSLPQMDGFGNVIPFVQLDRRADPEQVAAKLLDKYVQYWDFYKRTNDGNTMIWGSTLTRLDRFYFSPINNFFLRKGDKTLTNILLLVALVLLVSAIFNYINLTVAQAGKRAKEMATRRLLGDTVGGVVIRYFNEAVLFTTACFVVGLLLAFVLIPLFNEMLATQISLQLRPTDLLLILILLLGMAFISGIIPAGMVARFNPIDVMKGSLRMKSKMWFSKVFIVAQGIVSTILIAMGLTMTLQMHHLATLSYGYTTKERVVINSGLVGTDLDRQMVLTERLKALPAVAKAVPGGGTPWACGANGVPDGNGDLKGWLRMCRLDSTAMQMLDIEVVEQYGLPTAGKVWLTEQAQRFFGVSREHPSFGYRDGQPAYECCGVVKDFRAGGPISVELDNCYNAIMVADPEGYFFTTLVQTLGDRYQALAAIRRTCAEVALELTGKPLDLHPQYIEDAMRDSLKAKRNTMYLVLTFMVISIVISALGLLAMSVYYGELQRKQIALRKVMGATVAGAAWTLSSRFLILSVVSVVIALPLSIRVMQQYLADFVYQIPMPWWVLPVAALFTLLIAFLSVVSRTLKVAMTNPIEYTKAE